jgi:uridylate kinase
MDTKKHIVISLGGSLIIPDNIDVVFLKSFITLINEYVQNGYKFLIITGGGKICRRYNDSLKQIVSPTNEDLDWLGISATRLNAEFVRISFGDLAYEKVVLDPDLIPETTKPIMIGGGWKPGNSSDLAAVHGARSIGANKIINLSNIDYVYEQDPKINPDAKRIEKISWKNFQTLFSTKWSPGINVPFDPTAAASAAELLFEVAILNGKNIENLKNYLDGKEFIGTVIS